MESSERSQKEHVSNLIHTERAQETVLGVLFSRHVERTKSDLDVAILGNRTLPERPTASAQAFGRSKRDYAQHPPKAKRGGIRGLYA